MKLHGEDGKVFVVNRDGVKLWELLLTDISVDQPFRDSTRIELKAHGGLV